MGYPKSGKNGTATWEGDEIGHVFNIQRNKSVGAATYASNKTAGKVSRIAGHQDAEGSFSVYERPSFEEGDFGTLVLKEDSSIEVFNGRALIISIQTTVPIEEREGKVAYEIAWGQAPVDEDDSSEAT